MLDEISSAGDALEVTAGGVVSSNTSNLLLSAGGSYVEIDATKTLDAASIDRKAAGTVTIGATNATGVTLGKTDNTVTVAGGFATSGNAATGFQVPTADSAAFRVHDGSNDYFNVNTSVGSESVVIGSLAIEPGITFYGKNTMQSPADSGALSVTDGSNSYININMTASAEAIAIGNTVTNPDWTWNGSGTITQSGSGQVTFNGNVDLNGGVDIDGNISVSEPTGNTAVLDMTDGGSAAVSAANHGKLRYNESTQQFEVSENTGAWAALGGITGSGTDERLMRWSTGNTAQDSGVTLDDSDNMSGLTSVAIGATPATTGQFKVTDGFQMWGRTGATNVPILRQSGSIVYVGGSSGVGTIAIQGGAGGIINLQPVAGSNSATLDSTQLTMYEPIHMEASPIRFDRTVTDATIEYEFASLAAAAKNLYVKGQDRNSVDTGQTAGHVYVLAGGDNGSTNATGGNTYVRAGSGSGTGSDGTVYVGDADTDLVQLGTSSADTVIGGVLRGPNTGAGLTVGLAGATDPGGSALQVVSMTTTQRDYLTEANGMIVYNTTANQIQGYANGSWVDLGGAAGSSPWTLSGGVIYPDNSTDDVVIGGSAMLGSEKFRVIGVTSLQGDLNFETGAARVISQNDETTSSDADLFTVRAANNTNGLSGAGGAITVSGGSGNAGAGGASQLLGGNSSAAAGGAAYVRGGSGTTDGQVYVGDSNTSQLNLAANGVETYIGYWLRFAYTGANQYIAHVKATGASAAGTTFQVFSGAGSDADASNPAGASGDLDLRATGGAWAGAGSSTQPASAGGDVSLWAGDGGTDNGGGGGAGGYVEIRGGAGSGAEADGYVVVRDTANALDLAKFEDATISLGNTTDNPALTQLGSGQVTFGGNVNANAGLDVAGTNLTCNAGFSQTGGSFGFEGTAFDLDPTGAFTLDMDAGQGAIVTVADNLAVAFQIKEGANVYFEVDTSDGTEEIILGNSTTNPLLTQNGTGDVTFNGAVGANRGLTVTGASQSFVVQCQNIDLDPTGAFTLDMDAGQAVTISVADNLANALLVQQGANAYIDVTTTDAAEKIEFGNTTTNPDYEFLGSGSVKAKTVVFDEYENGNFGATPTLDWNNGQKQHGTLSANATFTFTAPAAEGNFTLRFTQGAGGYTVTWPAAVKWPGGTAPNLNPQTGGEINVVTFYYDGTSYYGQAALDFQ
jgi:hypothetical protein